MSAVAKSPVLEGLRVGAFVIPTDAKESDGTLEWDRTTLIVVELRAGDKVGLGYTYSHASVADLVLDTLGAALKGKAPLAIEDHWHTMMGAVRNLGPRGLAMTAISAVDCALWDLKAHLLGLPLVDLLGAVREELPLYGSGGFTSYSDTQLSEQFLAWQHQGITRFKMKVGRDPARDLHRVRHARATVGKEAELYVDANSAYSRKQALAFAQVFAEDYDVRWLEEPLPIADLEGLRELRLRVPATVEIAEGEYGYDLDYFRRLLAAEAVDVVMADVTRCGGITGFLKIATLCETWNLPLSAHCAPALHVHVGCAVAPLRHAEFFHDHERIEAMLFDGVSAPQDGGLKPDHHRAGLGLTFKWADAQRFSV